MTHSLTVTTPLDLRTRIGALLLMLLLCLVAPVLAGVGSAMADDRVGPQSLIGKPAPDFVLKSLKGPNVRLSDHRGEVVMLGFWTSWCGGCRSELEQMARLLEIYRSAGLVVLGVSLDDERAKANAFASSHGGNVPHAFDAEKAVGRSFAIADVPFTMLIDRDGVVRYLHGEYGRRDEADLVQKIRELLDE